MSRGIATTFAEWRFLLLTLLICAFLLTTPLIPGNWPVQMVLEALLLATVLVTVSANPGWHKLRRVLVVLWLVSVAGTLLSVFSIRPELWQWYRSVELLTLVPVLAVVATGMLAFVRRKRTLTMYSIFATVAAYLLLALLFTQFYLWLITWDPASFSLPVEAAGRPVHLLQADMTYFSLVTLATRSGGAEVAGGAGSRHRPPELCKSRPALTQWDLLLRARRLITLQTLAAATIRETQSLRQALIG